MKNRFTILTAAFALLAFLAVPLGMWGQTEVSWTASEQGYENAAEVTNITIDANITGTFAKANGTTTPKYYTSGEAVRMYNNNTLTITPGSECEITEIVFTFSQSGGFTVSDGEYSVENLTGTWTGSSTDPVVFTNGSTQNRIQVITVTYTGGGTPTVATPTFYPESGTYYESQTVTISCETPDVTIYYTTDGSIPDDESTEYTAPFTIEQSTILKAIAYDGENNASSVATAYYAITLPSVATPTFDPASGSYNEIQTVTINCATEGATIYYTLDGTDPTISSAEYSEALTINETTTVKAMAAKENMNNSAIATAVYAINLPYSGDDYVRISSLDELTDGDRVIIAARYNSTVNAYYAMTAAASGKPTGVAFTSTTSSDGEALPTEILDEESTYYWTVNVTTDGYTFTNASNAVLGYTTGTNFAPGGNNTAWTITRNTSGNSAMVAGYEGFYIINKNETGRGIALNSQHNFGPYAVSNNNTSSYNFYLDFFVQGAEAAITPSISANNVEIAYDATSGSITYTINNGVNGGTLTASTNDTWLTLGTVGETVPFTCSANEASAARTATVTLTYTYNRETVTKDVTVTQAGNPNVLNNISDITEVGSNYHVKGMVVATSAKGFIIGDGTGLVYTYLNAAPTQQMGDFVQITGKTGSYGHVIQFAPNNSSTPATIAEAETFDFEWPEITVITEVPNYTEGYHLSDYFQFEGKLTTATSSNNTTYYNIAVGEGQIRISYPTDEQAADLETLLNKTVRIHGFFTGYSSNVFTAMMESYEEVVAPAVPSVTVTPNVIEAPAEGVDGTLAITYENIPELISFDMYFCDANGVELEEDPDWILTEIQEENNTYSVYYVIDVNEGEARTAYFKVYTTDTPGNEEVYAIVTVNQAAYVAPPTPGEWVLTPFAELTSEDIFVITGTNANGTYAMTNNNGTGSAPAAVAVTVAGETLSGEIADTLKWNMTYDAETGYTFYPNGQTATWLYCTNTNNGVRVGTNTNNVFVLDAETGYLMNVATSRYLGIYNAQDWRCYTNTTGNIANQTFAFYKKVVDPTAPKITVSPSTLDVSATEVDINTLSITLDNLEVASASDFTVQFYDASGEEQEMPEWILAQAAGNINYGGYTVACVTIPNPGAARTAYFRVYANDANNNVVYSNLVTVSQASDPTYAVLPFQYDDDGSAITETDGLYSIGINNLDESPKLDFFRTGSWLLLQFQEAPGTLTFDIKGVDFAGGTFKVMTSADGETYTDIATYTDTELGDEIQTMEFDNLSENVRFIKWVYTEQVDGDVALGNITLAKPYIPPFTGDTYTLATSVEPGRHYIIVGFNGDNAYAMGGQNGNNRAAVSINVVDGVAQVASEDVVEFVVNSVGFTDEVDPYSGQQSVGSGMAVYPGYWQYTIYDPADLGYLYAASSSSNYLRTETHLDADDNGVWSIEIYNETINEIEYENVAHIVAFGNNTRKLMRFNSASGVFSCYGDGNNQKDVYLYVKNEDVPQYDFYKDITGYGTSNGGYCLVATPTTESANPNMVGMITDDGTNPENFSYDLYSFDFTQELEWLNYRAGAFNLLNGQGYLYANQSNVTLHFQGASYASKTVNLQFGDTNYDWNGWNLIGNPLSDVAWIGTDNFYVMNADGTEVELAERSYVNPMEGIFVKASAANQSIYFTNDFWYYEEPGGGFDFRVSGENGSDVARVCFGEGQDLEKFQLNPNHTKVYFEQGNKNYAVVRSANEGEMPVSFKAENNGSYTITVDAKNLEMNYLHIIDNMTGADVDLLVEPSYSFEAKTTDYASRFKLVFSTNSTNENGNETFAFFNGSEWSISNIGEATLQVVDVTGRIIISETVNGNVTLTTDNLSAGVYVMRLVNGNNVKTQKVIVR